MKNLGLGFTEKSDFQGAGLGGEGSWKTNMEGGIV